MKTHTTIDSELKACADLALANAYFHELQALVAKYRAAAADLGTDMETGQRQVEMHTWGDNADGTLVAHDALDLWVDWPLPKGNILGPGARASNGCQTLIEALEHPKAERIGLNGEVIFEKKNGDWFVAGEEPK